MIEDICEDNEPAYKVIVLVTHTSHSTDLTKRFGKCVPAILKYIAK